MYVTRFVTYDLECFAWIFNPRSTRWRSCSNFPTCATPNGLAVGAGVAGRAATALKTKRSSSISTELTNPRLPDRPSRRFMDEPSSVSLWTYRHVHSSVLDKDQVRAAQHYYNPHRALMPVGASEGDKKNFVTVGFFCTKRRENGGVKSDRTTARAVRAKLA
jgi:hypothetical protein